MLVSPFRFHKTNLVHNAYTGIGSLFFLFRLWRIQVLHLDFKNRFLLSPIIKQLSYHDGGTSVQDTQDILRYKEVQ